MSLFSAPWYYYVGYFAICLLLFFYFATRKKYRDPTAAPNYEKIRNKVTTRKLKVEEPEIEVESGVGISISSVVSLFVVIVVGVSLIGPITSQVVSVTNSQIQTQTFGMHVVCINGNCTEINDPPSSSIAMENVTTFGATVLKLIPGIFTLMIIGVVLVIIFAVWRTSKDAGLV